MKTLTLLLLMLLACNILSAQQPDRFRNFHGIVQEHNHFFEAEGHDIFIRTADYPLTEKGISKMIKQYDMKGSQRTDTLIGNKAVVLVKKETRDGFEYTSVCYLISKNEYTTFAIGMMGLKRDRSLEHFVVKAWLDKSIPDYVYTVLALGNSFDFIGRKITLGGLCNWMSPHNIQCPNNGQMSWSLFNSESEALASRDMQLDIVKNKNMTSILEETWVPVTFEGVSVKARKLKVKIKLPTLIMGGSNILIVYYVTASVRNQYVTCVLSHYTDDANGKELAPLLQQVMTVNDDK